jgi:hypothetical protein
MAIQKELGLQPFGTPEGSRADIKELKDERFVHFQGNVAKFGGLAISASDLSARVFVGRKGAGKTVYLRRAQAYAQDQPELFADDIQQELPTTTQIFGVNRWFAPAVLTQVWMSIWRVAVLRSLFSYLAYEPLLHKESTEEFRSRMLKDYGRWLPEQPDPMSVYSQVRAIIRVNRDGPRLHAFLTHEDWDAVEARLARHLENCRPVCFYLDAVDEEFRHAPMHWIMCQKGLFYQVMRFLRDSRLGGRLHIVISIRDLVYSSVMQTEHMTRYVDPDRIRLLEWNRDAIAYLLRIKVGQLGRENYLGDPEDSNRLRGWLGIGKIENERRKVHEDLELYLLRHTRLIPRDTVILLNMLHVIARGAKEAGRALDEREIRETVSTAAKLFGTEQLAIAGNQLAIGDAPTAAADFDFVDLYSGEHPGGLSREWDIAPGIEFDEKLERYEYRGLDVYDGDNPVLEAAAAYQRGIIDELSGLLLDIRWDRFGRKRFAVAQEAAERRFPRGRALSVLWQNGLLGYTEGKVETGEPVFYSATRADPLDIPSDKPGYVLHPCLIDAIGIKSKGAPVYPFECSPR